MYCKMLCFILMFQRVLLCRCDKGGEVGGNRKPDKFEPCFSQPLANWRLHFIQAELKVFLTQVKDCSSSMLVSRASVA